MRLLLTSQDVIHVLVGAWRSAVKKDAIPGMVNEMWFQIQPDKAGLYRGQCAELCGRDHGFMPIVVEAKTQEEFAAWLASVQLRPPAAEPAAASVAPVAAAAN